MSRDPFEPGEATPRIFVEQVRVACSSPRRRAWRRRRGTDPLTYPVHGWLHRADQAVKTDVKTVDRTLCGLRLDDLRWHDLDHLRWTVVQPSQQCRVCAVVLDQ